MTTRALTLMLACSLPAFGGSGTVTIASISGSSPGPYTIDVNSTAGVTAGDYFGCRLASGRGAIYAVSSITDSDTLVVTDSLTDNEVAVFGPPSTAAGTSAWYATPTSSEAGMALPPYTGVGWDAAHRLNFERLAGRCVLSQTSTPSASDSTSSFATITTFTIPANYFAEAGDAVRVKLNVRQDGGSGVILAFAINAGSETTSVTIDPADVELMAVRSSVAGELDLYTRVTGATCAYTKDTVTGVTFTAAISLTVRVKGNGAVGSTVVDYRLCEQLR